MQEKYQKQERRMSGLLFSGRTILDEDLALVIMSNKKIKLCKPIMVGSPYWNFLST